VTWATLATASATPLNALSWARSALPSDGIATPAIRLMGYQMLP
jgi:hypothetical protein